MLNDRYDNALSTQSDTARDAYIDGLDRFLAADAGVIAALDAALAADPGFALAHLAKARQFQMTGDRDGMSAALANARFHSEGLTARETSQINCMGLLLEGKVPAAYAAIRAHLDECPRDALVAQTCIGVFGLIGFSGQPGREAEQLAFTTLLAPHYGEDWWFLGGHAFAQVEAGQTAKASETVERSLALHPRNANSAHYKAHIHYEAGESAAGLSYMDDWRRDYSRDGMLHTHCSWHVALWALEQGDTARMWQVVDADVGPGAGTGPAINVLTDTAAILYRAALAGVDVPHDRWVETSAYATRFFPKPGLAFADVHAALAHAMAGDAEALQRIISDARGPAGDMVKLMAEGFAAIGAGRWADATAHLAKTLSDHARIGGSRAQRDLIEYAMLGCLLKQGLTDEAARLLAMRRPAQAASHPVKGV